MDGFRRDPGAPFDDVPREEYAKSRAKGGAMKVSAAIAGIEPATATKWERHPAMRERIRELRQGAENFVGVSKAWIIQQLKINAEAAREENAYKSSNEALGMIYKIISEDRDVSHQMARALPHDVTPQELQKRLRSQFAKPALPKGRENFALPNAPKEDAEEVAE